MGVATMYSLPGVIAEVAVMVYSLSFQFLLCI
ncbi:hypothetical protein Loa_02943 [Legionella oakridgensis ATCC 33761 = DSM 21215]|uniref:Uncharacterized protein n=1 Tax=Legionella oakridgensis ATCC 33761 = DSM 21215 TaxID=1268635 RepID=W0BID8_9GAMM|nr:hypothetical protein Loa_02943 [Legionella oakridgensis ATCC 33761 = DSM 21215]